MSSHRFNICNSDEDDSHYKHQNNEECPSNKASYKDDGSNAHSSSETNKMLVDFSSRLGDDLNISGALGELFIWVNYLFAALDDRKLDYSSAKGALAALEQIDIVLGVIDNVNIDLDENIKKLIAERDKARLEKDWDKADEVRKQLDKIGITLDDSPPGHVPIYPIP